MTDKSFIADLIKLGRHEELKCWRKATQKKLPQSVENLNWHREIIVAFNYRIIEATDILVFQSRDSRTLSALKQRHRINERWVAF